MIDYAVDGGPNRHRVRKIIVGLVLLAALSVAGVFIVQQAYVRNLRPVSASQEAQEILVADGSTVREIGRVLEEEGLIRNRFVFELYARYGDGKGGLRAGTYLLRPNMSVQEIVSVITDGKVVSSLFTILPGQRLDQIKQAFLNAGFSAADVEEALSPSRYTGHPALANLPTGSSLEGYLYPDSFERTSATKPETIVNQSLDLMAEKLTDGIKTGFATQALSDFDGIILSSIVEKEVSGKNPDDRPMVARVFLNRLAQGMKLGSDVTAVYGAKVTGQNLTVGESIGYDSPYNTRMHEGLPPGPISNVSSSSMNAVANPANHNYLYFVSGDDGVTYFAQTYEQHLQNVAAHCKELCDL